MKEREEIPLSLSFAPNKITRISFVTCCCSVHVLWSERLRWSQSAIQRRGSVWTTQRRSCPPTLTGRSSGDEPV